MLCLFGLIDWLVDWLVGYIYIKWYPPIIGMHSSHKWYLLYCTLQVGDS